VTAGTGGVATQVAQVRQRPDERLAIDVGLEGAVGTTAWRASDAGGAAFRVARSGCFRVAVLLPPTATVKDVRALRVRAYTRPPRRGEARLPPGTGSARLDRVNRLFGLGPDGRPAPSVFGWSLGRELAPDGAPLELPVPQASRRP